ncbi:MAG: hypothetical protein WC651_01800 [Candidatus Gracilibacteria bacterium]|jgi:hypothetical protein
MESFEGFNLDREERLIEADVDMKRLRYEAKYLKWWRKNNPAVDAKRSEYEAKYLKWWEENKNNVVVKDEEDLSVVGGVSFAEFCHGEGSNCRKILPGLKIHRARVWDEDPSSLKKSGVSRHGIEWERERDKAFDKRLRAALRAILR